MPSPTGPVPDRAPHVSPHRVNESSGDTRQRLAARARGRWGEDQAARLFHRLGYEVLARNWRSPFRELGGELDIIAIDGDVVVFCEVKARQRSNYGGASAAVDHRKQEQVRSLASAWLIESGMSGRDCRFDVVACDGIRVTHHIAAF